MRQFSSFLAYGGIAMKMIQINCPNCNGELTVAEDRKELFCEYCGTKILVEDDSVKTHIVRDEARLKELEMEQALIDKREEAHKWRAIDYISLVLCVVSSIAILYLPKDNDKTFLQTCIILADAAIWIVSLIMTFYRYSYRHRYDENPKAGK